ncbi:MAG TPA: hypothetical protein VGA17_06290 [Nitrospiraceae bacterium]
MILRAMTRVLVLVLLCGCATTVPYTGAGPHPQLERGHPVPPIDALGNLLAVFPKLLLWDWRFANHYISPDTESYVVAYLAAREVEMLTDTQFRLNQWSPGNDLSRLVKNGHVGWPYRLILGLPTTLIVDVLLPGRLFPWGDYYNPWTNTVHLYSNHSAIALHEAGHAFDTGTQRFKGTYSAARLIPFVDLYQEWQASDDAIAYFEESGEQDAELAAYKILYPAFGTYVGAYIFPPIGTVAGAIAGHAAGRSKAALKTSRYRREAPAPSQPPQPVPTAP